MDWITIGSLTLNAIAVAVYLKVPEFLQSFLIKRIEHNFSEKMNEIQYEQEKELSRIQSEFQKERQQMEHNFQVNLDTLKKKKEILPELYKKVIMAYSYYYYGEDYIREDKKEFAKNGLIYLAEIRNYFTFNKFYMNEVIYNQVKEFDDIAKKIIAIEHSEYLNADVSSKTFIQLKEQEEEIYEALKENIRGLEKLIYDEINN